MDWYYAANRQQLGPVSDEEFQKLVQAGTIKPDTLVWHDGMPNWVPLSNSGAAVPAPAATDADPQAPASAAPRLSVLRPATAPAPTGPTVRTGMGICAECGRHFPVDQMIQYENSTICAECKPKFFQRLQEGAELPGFLNYAGFWIRFGAKFIDGLILMAVNTVITMAAGALGWAASSAQSTGFIIGTQLMLAGLQLAAGLAYSVFFVGKFGATPGKMACKLRIVRASGAKVSYGRAVGRYFAEMLSGIILYIGYIMVAFDEEKRALHDRICDTRVIRV